MQPLNRYAKFHVYAMAAVLGLLGGTALAALDTPSYQVSQKGRAFQPGELTIRRAQTVQIINVTATLYITPMWIRSSSTSTPVTSNQTARRM